MNKTKAAKIAQQARKRAAARRRGGEPIEPSRLLDDRWWFVVHVDDGIEHGPFWTFRDACRAASVTRTRQLDDELYESVPTVAAGATGRQRTVAIGTLRALRRHGFDHFFDEVLKRIDK